MTFGRQVYCQILDHLIFVCVCVCSFLHGCGCFFFFLVNVMHLQGWSKGAACQGHAAHIHIVYFYLLIYLLVSPIVSGFKLVSPGPLLPCKSRSLGATSSRSSLACHLLPKLTPILCLLLGAFLSPLVFEAGHWASPLYLNRICFPLGFARSHS